MGTIGKYGTETTAPEYHCSAFGTPSWSGKHESQIDRQLELDLGNFIRFEALRKGNNDFVQECVGENQFFFDERFLDGWPNEMWKEYYLMGANQAKERLNR